MVEFLDHPNLPSWNERRAEEERNGGIAGWMQRRYGGRMNAGVAVNREASREEVIADMAQMLAFSAEADEIINKESDGSLTKEESQALLDDHAMRVVKFLNARGHTLPEDTPLFNDDEMTEILDMTGTWAKFRQHFGDDAEGVVDFLAAYARTGVFPILESDQGFADGTRRIRALERIGG